MRKTQQQQVIEQLEKYGMVSRNWALDRHITRLAAIILDLKAAGWEFTPKDEGRDYVYHLSGEPKKAPKQVVEFLPTGEVRVSYI